MRDYSDQGIENPNFIRTLRDPKYITNLVIPTDLSDPICYTLDENGCWVWNFSKSGDGYAFVQHNGKYVSVARLVCRILDRPDREVCHGPLCNRACYNPDHLRIDSKSGNQIDCVKDGTNRHQILTEAQVRMIKYDFLEFDGKNFHYSYRGQGKDLAKDFDVTRATIYSIKRQRSWSWV